MENQKNIPEQLNQSLQLTDLKADTIGYNKYQMLKSLPATSLTDLEKKQMTDFELSRLPSINQQEASKKYIRDMLSTKTESSFTITALRLWNVFKVKFETVTKKKFEKNDFTVKNLKPLIYYFSRDQRFFECENIFRSSEPSFDKGLLIIGTYGNGKTSVMKTFEEIFKTTKGVSFKGYTANEIVKLYEKCNDAITKSELTKKVNSGSRYFDDVKTEREVSNYGKVNIFKDIIEERYSNKISVIRGKEVINKTYITCNYKEGFDGDIHAALEEFGEKYGGRVYDRLFDMFNIIEFKGPSFRK